MEATDLKVGNTYRAKKPAPAGSMFKPVYNDRQILWISMDKSIVQYDGPAVPFGRRFPKISIEKFLRWAGEDVTAEQDSCDWTPFP